MVFEVRIPSLGESVTEGVIVQWRKRDGEAVAANDVLLELETDKANMEIPAEHGGVLRILKTKGETVAVGELVARIEDGATAAAPAPGPTPAAPAPGPTPAAAAAPPAEPVREAAAQPERRPAAAARGVGPLSPAVRRLLSEHGLDPAAIAATGRGGRLTKEDVLAHLERAPGVQVPAAP